MIKIKVTYEGGSTRIFPAVKFSSGLRTIAREVKGTGAYKVELVKEKK